MLIKIGKLISLILILISLSASLYAEARVDAVLSSDEVAMDGSVVLTITVEGDSGSFGFPKLPAMDRLAVVSSSQSSQFSWINGKVTSTKQFQYTLAPRSPGVAKIPAMQMTIGGETFSTRELSVNVVGSVSSDGVQPKTHSAKSAAGIEKTMERSQPEVFLQASVSNPTPYVGEQILYRVKFFRRINLFSDVSYQQPPFKGFLVYQLDKDKAQQSYTETVGGTDYHVDEIRIIIVPVAKADSTIIPPAKVSAQFSFFDNPKAIPSKPVQVRVQALPANGGPDFLGGIGEYKFSAHMDNPSVAVGDVVNVVLSVTGEGNIKDAVLPELKLPEEIKKFDSKESLELNVVGDKLKGTKKYNLVLIPGVAGQYRFAPIKFTYFSASQHRYITTTADLPELVVRKGKDGAVQGSQPVYSYNKKTVTQVKTDINYIEDKSPGIPFEPFYRSAFFIYSLILAFFALLLDICYLLFAWYRRSNQDLLKRKSAVRLGLRRLDGAGISLKKGDTKAFYTGVSEAFMVVIASKFGLSVQGLTRLEIVDKSATAGMPAELIDRMIAILDNCDLYRFASTSATEQSRTALLQEAADLLHQMEKYFR